MFEQDHGESSSRFYPLVEIVECLPHYCYKPRDVAIRGPCMYV